MLISSYSLQGNSYGRGYRDDPYIMESLYVRGDSSVTWTINGTGRFGINLSDMTCSLFERGSYYTIVSVFVNGVLARTMNGPMSMETDFGIVLDLEDEVSTVDLRFSGFDTSLLYINKISSFIFEYAPSVALPAETTTSEPEIPTEVTGGIIIADVDFGSQCGTYNIRVIPNTGEFELRNNELWFTGDQTVEREYNVKVQAYNNNTILNTKSIPFSIVHCNSSGDCSDSSGGGGGGTVDPEMDTIRDISISTGSCGYYSGTQMVLVTITWTGDEDKSYDLQISRGNLFSIIHLEYSSLSEKTLQVLLEVNDTFFVRGRQRAGRDISDWSQEVQFSTMFIGDCEGTIEVPEEPAITPIPCLDPDSPEEPPADPDDPVDPDDPENPENPSNPTPGPNPCRGNGCGEETPSNPTPGQPCCYTPPGCIGPGCSPGSRPIPPDSSPGTPSGTPGGPGGPEDPDPPEEYPPQNPIPPSPTCEDDRLHTTVLSVENHADPGSNEGIEVHIKWDAENSDTCSDYLARIGKEDWTPIVPSVMVEAGATELIDLGAACPECINICMMSDNDTEATWKLLSVGYDNNGNPTEPYVADQSTESTKPICDCTNYSISDMYPAKSVNLGGQHTERIILDSFSGTLNPKYAMLRTLEPNEECITFRHEAFNVPTANGMASHQYRAKLACYACTDRGFKEITSEIIGCEVMSTTVHADTSGDVPQPRHVTVANHWKMGQSTQTYAKNEWPKNNEFGDWHFDVTPFRSSWDLEVPLCVACCRYTDWGSSPWTGKTRTTTSGNRGVSTNPTNLYNNIDCNIGDPEVAMDQNWDGHGSGDDDFRPCSVASWSWEVLDAYGIANLKWKYKQLGYSDITLDEANAVTANLGNNGTSTTCEGYTHEENICIQPHQGNYSYLLELDNQTKACNYVPSDPYDRGQMYYMFRPYATSPAQSILYNGTISNTQACGDTHHYEDGITVSCIQNDFGEWTVPGASNCAGQAIPWPEYGADGLPIAKDRYTFKYYGEPYSLGTGAVSVNPLP